MRSARRVSARGAVVLGAAAAVAALYLSGCQFPEYDITPSVGGAAGRGGSTGAAGAGAESGSGAGGSVAGGSGSSSQGCGIGKTCAVAVPTGWLGPVAFWQAKAGDEESPPDCPEGYEQPLDLRRGLTAAPVSCECACAAGGQVCEKAASVSIYTDRTCQNECAGGSPLVCATVSGCNGNQGSVHAEKPAPTGGSCTASVDASEPELATWQYSARLCELSAVEGSTCTGEGETCAPTPEQPYVSQLCVIRVVPEGQTLPECPEQYPSGGDAFYEDFEDDRSCGQCSCDSEPSGGSCEGKLHLSAANNDCSNSFDYTLGSGCKEFSLMTRPTHWSAQYTLSPGSCGIASDTQPTGSARPSGSATVVCCL